MVNLSGNMVYLRALEPEDLELIFEIENDMSYWELSDTRTPYSKYVLKHYLVNAHKDIYESKQLRLVICKLSGDSIGLVDVFDFDPKNRRAGLGIIIKDINERQKGYASEALNLITEYCFSILHIHQVYADVDETNDQSLKLFLNQGFRKVGTKKEWRYDGSKYHNVILMQKLKAY